MDSKHMGELKNANMKGAFSNLVEMLKLDKKVIAKVAGDASMTTPAIIFLVVGVLLTPIVSLMVGGFSSLGFNILLMSGIMGLIMNAAVIFGMAFIGEKLFKGKASFLELFRVLGLVSGIGVVGVLALFVTSLGSMLSLVIWIWSMVVGYVAIKEVSQLNDTNTVLTIVLAVIAAMIVGQIVAQILGTIGLSAFPGTGGTGIDFGY